MENITPELIAELIISEISISDIIQEVKDEINELIEEIEANEKEIIVIGEIEDILS